MRIIPHFNFEQLSFWLGFLAASLFWWLFSKFKFIFPQIKSFAARQKENFQKRRTFGTELYLRREILKKAQRLHLANELFALDEILIEPHLIAPPTPITPDNPIRSDTLVDQSIPYYPDLPELSAPFNTTRLTLAEALQRGANILVTGQPGCGKTVGLANLASQVARKDNSIGNLKEKLPVFLHVLDLDLSLPEKGPDIILIQALSEQSTALISKRLSNLITRYLTQGKCLLILDGLDELPPAEIRLASKFLNSLSQKFPGNQFIAAASPDYIDGLSDLNTYPLALSLWNHKEKAAFSEKWGRLWKENIASKISETNSTKVLNPTVLINWFIHDTNSHSPLEWTLRVWAAFAGDAAGSRLIDAVNAYLDRISKNTVPAEALSAGAIELIQSRQPSISYKTLSKTFSRLRPQDFPEEEEKSPLAEIDLPTLEGVRGKKSSKRKRARKISSADRAITTLLDAGLLIEHRNEQLRFVSPLFTGYFAALLLEDINFETVEKERWAAEQSALQFMAARDKAMLWVQEQLRGFEQPFFLSLLSVCRALQYASTNSQWRPDIMRYLLEHLHDQHLSLNERVRLLTAFTITNDSSLPILFRKLLKSETPEIRFLAALGCGLVQDTESVVQLQQALRDPVIEVQIAACLGLSTIPSPIAFQSIVDALLQGEEDLQQIAAELLSSYGKEGHEVLKEALELDNLMIRRAAVLGLSQIAEEWAAELLQKVSIEDSQWVVRNAAGQAHDASLLPNRQIPHPLTRPSETSWLIAFASEQGLGIAPDEDAIEILLSALKTGSTAERIAALAYLRLTPDQEIIQTVASTIETALGDLQLASHQALWQLKISETKTI